MYSEIGFDETKLTFDTQNYTSRKMEDNFGEVCMIENEQYASRSYIEMPQTGEVNYISTIVGVRGNPIYKGKGVWIEKENASFSTVKVDKDDIRAKRHYVKTLLRDGREVKIWECGLCGKEFRFQYTLVRHIPTHTDVRNYQCDSCPKAFRQLSTLAQHKATHLNMRPFLCDFCMKSFNRISTLISHKKIHYDEKRHICPFCGKGFHQKGNLRNHMYTHTNERPYKCDVCHKGFNQKSNLVCHKVSTHAKKYHCEICVTTFTKEASYAAHMEVVHNLNMKLSSKSSETLKEPNMECTLVDDSDKVLLQLPVTKTTKTPTQDNIAKATSQTNENIENEILTVIKHKPTEAMNQLKDINKVPFVLFYQPSEPQPKICKAIVNGDEYALVHPSNSDISKYLTQNTNSYSHKFPIVSTIIQKKDLEGKLQTLVLPAGLNPQVVESDESAKGLNVFDYYRCLGESSSSNVFSRKLPGFEPKAEKTSVIFTKTQPSVRQAKPKTVERLTAKLVPKGKPEGSVVTLREIMPSIDNIIDNSPIYQVCKKEDNIGTTTAMSSESQPLSSKDIYFMPNDDNMSIKEMTFVLPETKSAEMKPIKEEIFQIRAPDKEEKKLHSIPTKKDISEPTVDVIDNIEPTVLFNSSDSLKDQFLKYNVDFDTTTFDFLDDIFPEANQKNVSKSFEPSHNEQDDINSAIKQEPDWYFY